MPATIDMLPATPDVKPLPKTKGGFQTVLADPPGRRCFARRTVKRSSASTSASAPFNSHPQID